MQFNIVSNVLFLIYFMKCNYALPISEQMTFEHQRQEFRESEAPSPYQQQHPFNPPCSTNLLIGCHPHVQAVSCSGHYAPAEYHAPSEYYAAHTPVYMPAAPVYQTLPMDVYPKPGPPYHDSNLPAAYPQARQFEDDSSEQMPMQNDNQSESSNHFQNKNDAENDDLRANTDDDKNVNKNESTIENIEADFENRNENTNNEKNEILIPNNSNVTNDVFAEQTTAVKNKIDEVSTTTSLPLVVTSPESGVENLKKKIDEHVRKVAQFREVIEEKLRNKFQQPAHADYSQYATDYEKLLKSCNQLKALQAKHLLNSAKMTKKL